MHRTTKQTKCCQARHPSADMQEIHAYNKILELSSSKRTNERMQDYD